MIDYPNIDPVAVSIGPLSVHWYGIMYLLGFSGAYLLANYRARRSNGIWNEEQVSDAVFYGAIGVILGGRVGYVFFYQFFNFLDDPLSLFRIWDGGMSFHGGLIGVMVMMALFARKHKKNFVDVMDFFCACYPHWFGNRTYRQLYWRGIMGQANRRFLGYDISE